VLCEDGVHRFPRLIRDYPRHALGALKVSKMQRYKAMILAGKPPKGWHRLTRRQKRIARAVASGMSIGEVCRREGMSNNTFYHWINCHPLFQKYYFRQAARNSGVVENRLDAAVARAVRVVEDSLHSGDPYFAHEAAVQLLKGRGKYKQAMNVKKEGHIDHTFAGRVEIDQKLTVKDERAAQMLVELMGKMASGENVFQPKIIDAKVVKELPPAVIQDPLEKKEENAPAQVQKRKQAKAVGGD
jgi:transposase-like protein